jgi:serine phosphatase RsbU (regulator of sigma subunit)
MLGRCVPGQGQTAEMALVLTRRPEQAAKPPATRPQGQVPPGGVPPDGRRLRWGAHPLVMTVLVAGLVLTAALTVSAELTYRHNEQRIATLQVQLTGQVLQASVGQVEARLDRVAGLAAEAADPSSVYRQAMRPLMRTSGGFVASVLSRLSHGRSQVLAHLGKLLFGNVTSNSAGALFARVAHSPSLVTARVVKGDLQRLVYLVSAHGRAGTVVVGAAQELRARERLRLPKGSPDANLNLAIYFGATADRPALVGATTARPPLRGEVSRVTVPFGDNVLTLVATPRGSLTGAWSEGAPWAILAAGVLASLGAAALTERLLRRNALAESRAALDRESYRRQRALAEDLQRALLPRALPDLAGLDVAARYLPSARDTQVGGDWYSVVAVDRRRCAFVVGDVAGHGLGAAGTMASLRYSMKALTRLGLSPSEVLEKAAAEHDLPAEDSFATAVAGIVDTARQELTLASAGHLPPLLLCGDQAELVELAPGPPIGVAHQPPEPTTVPFRPGSTLVAFTDGLVERRGEAIEDGLERLVSVAASLLPQSRSAEALATELISALSGPDREDDLALLVVTFVGGDVIVVP